jgi:peroxiredoxin family protein
MSGALAGIDPIDPRDETLRALEDRLDDLEGRVDGQRRENAVSLICFSGEWDRLFAAFVIANGALAMGQEVDIFLTFWAATALRDGSRKPTNRKFFDRMMGAMLPSGPEQAPLSRLNLCGLGKVMLRWRMRRAGVDRLDRLISQAREMGGRIHVCEMSAGILGIRTEDLIGGDGIDACGVATFLQTATKGKAVLFI